MNMHLCVCVNLYNYVCIPISIPCFFHIDIGILLHPVDTTQPRVLLAKFSMLFLKGDKKPVTNTFSHWIPVSR